MEIEEQYILDQGCFSETVVTLIKAEKGASYYLKSFSDSEGFCDIFIEANEYSEYKKLGKKLSTFKYVEEITSLIEAEEKLGNLDPYEPCY